MKRYLIAAILLCLWASVCYSDDVEFPYLDSAQQKLSKTEKELLKEYREQYLSLKDFYENIEIGANYNEYTSTPPSGTVFPAPHTDSLYLNNRTIIKYYCASPNRNKYKAFYRIDLEKHRVGDTGKDETEESITIADPEKVFYLIKKPKGSYRLALDSKTTPPILAKTVFLVQYPYSPFCYNGIDIPQRLFSLQNSHITDVRFLADEGVIVVHQTMRYPKGDINYEYRFLRNKHWALSSLKKHSANSVIGDKIIKMDTYETCQNVYENESDGVPLLKQVIVESSVRESNGEIKIKRKEQYDISYLTPGVPDTSVFEVSQFFTGKNR